MSSNELFKIVSINEGQYVVNTTALFDAFHCLDSDKTNSNFISDTANISLNCFFKNACEAFKSKWPFIIKDQQIHNHFELSKWISTHGTPEFQENMLKRFNKIFPADAYNNQQPE
ncbi:MAG: hypothetical protein HDQ96_01190 [Lachnospiraceae bacterium]|nr:hypothetical protein [Lachnospiraceae bacterium]